MLSIRDATARDTAEIERMVADFVRGHPAENHPRSSDALRVAFFGEQPVAHLLVAERDGEIVGMAQRSRGIAMNEDFPGAVPEVRVASVARAAVYYEKCLGFHWDWGVEGIGQVSRGRCRIFLTDNAFRGDTGTGAPSVIWLNLDSKAEIDELHQSWSDSGAQIVGKPESKPWNLYEFTAKDLDGNRIRVFYDFACELPDRGGRKDDADERQDARARF